MMGWLVYGAWLICLAVVQGWLMSDISQLKDEIESMRKELDAIERMLEDDDLK